MEPIENGKFRFFLQREFMLRDLNNEHEITKELGWVEQNAMLFSDYFDQANGNGELEREYKRTPESERPALIDAWLRDMREYMKKAA